MSDLDQRRNRYLVVKWDDIAILSDKRKEQLDYLLRRVEDYREAAGKTRSNDYIVVNIDEPYIQEIIDVLKRHGHWG
jgi:hypothetical protein